MLRRVIDPELLRYVWSAVPLVIRRLLPSNLKKRVWSSTLRFTSTRLAVPPGRDTVPGALLQAARQLSDYNKDAVALCNAAMLYDSSVSVAISSIEVLQEKKLIDEASRIADSVIALLDLSTKGSDRRLVTNIKRTDAYLISVTNSIPVRMSAQYEPVRNRIVYLLNSSLPFETNGYSTRSHGVVGGLQNADFDVIAITRPGYPFDSKNITGTPEDARNQVDNVRYHRIIEPSFRSAGTHEYLLKAADVVRHAIEHNRPSIVIAASDYRTALPALIAARKEGIPFVYEVRGFWELTRLSADPSFANTSMFKTLLEVESRVTAEADLVITLNTPMKNAIVSRGVPERKIFLLPNSVDERLFPAKMPDERLRSSLMIPVGVPVVGYVGSFADYEGLDDLVKACAQLRSQGLSFRLLLVGSEPTVDGEDGPVTKNIRKNARDYGLDDWLIMPGRVSHHQAPNYYSLIDIAPIPRKSFLVCELVSPLKLAEAMAMGKLVIVPNMPALAESIKHGETGIVFEKGKIAALADALSFSIQNPAERERIGRSARAFMLHERTWTHSVSAIAENLRRLH